MANVALMAGLDGPVAYAYLGKFGGAASYGLRAGLFGYLALNKNLPGWVRLVSVLFAAEDAYNTLYTLDVVSLLGTPRSK